MNIYSDIPTLEMDSAIHKKLNGNKAVRNMYIKADDEVRDLAQEINIDRKDTSSVQKAVAAADMVLIKAIEIVRKGDEDQIFAVYPYIVFAQTQLAGLDPWDVFETLYKLKYLLGILKKRIIETLSKKGDK